MVTIVVDDVDGQECKECNLTMLSFFQVSAFDHLLLSEHQLADDADFGQVKEYYAQM